MRLVIQRVSHAQLTFEEITRQIGRGYVVLVGIHQADTKHEVEYCAQKLVNLRIMPDSKEKMNLSLKDIKGEILIVSQFTLYATIKGNRPGFSEAAEPSKAEALYNYFVELVSREVEQVQSGKFGAKMLVEIHNDGPVTIIMDSQNVST